MHDQVRMKFGSVEVAAADIVANSTMLHLHLLDGTMNKHEVGMLIKMLQEKQEALKAMQEPIA